MKLPSVALLEIEQTGRYEAAASGHDINVST
jgi:hypothetical protein